jgi:hypothetical protein
MKMTDNINVTGYRTLETNRFWMKPAEPVNVGYGGEPVETARIYQLTRLHAPSSAEVMALIKHEVLQYDGHSTKASGSEKKELLEMPLSEYFNLFEPRVMEAIALGKEKYLKHIEKHIPEVEYDSGKMYLNMVQGLVPLKWVPQSQELAAQQGPHVYEHLLSKAGHKKWSLKIVLSPTLDLPDRLEMEYLLARGVRDCDVFRADGHYDQYAQVADNIRLLYSVLPTAEHMKRIFDSSDRLVLLAAIDALRTTATCLKTQDAVDQLVEGLGDIIDKTISGLDADCDSQSRTHPNFGDPTQN